jgi:hypothetical protein
MPGLGFLHIVKVTIFPLTLSPGAALEEAEHSLAVI